MSKSFRYGNKRIGARTSGGRFRKVTMADVGLGGICPTPGCNHFLIRVYDGDERDPFPDPRKFRNRCFTCEPKTEAELKLEAEIEASKPKPLSLFDLLSR